MAAPKITYATLSADNAEMNAALDAALVRVSSSFGKTHPMVINGAARVGQQTFPDISPIDTRITLGSFYQATRLDVDDAVAAARAAFSAWSRRPWQERVAVLRRAADLISERIYELSALVVLETGKSRLEALGEVEETADLVRYYIDQLQANDGYVAPMASQLGNDRNRSVLKPYGVWAVIAPFNFPVALSGGPIGAALVAGNTVVFKPAEDTPYGCLEMCKCFWDAGVPGAALNYLSGDGEVGAAIVQNQGVDGLTFTGSYEVGFHHVYREFARNYPKPAIIEMGGKNPAIVTASADLDIAAMGVARSAFGLDGQKCSACSRVYVHEDVKEVFLQKLVGVTDRLKIGDPRYKETFMGPVTQKEAFERYRTTISHAQADGVVVYGGDTLDEGEYAHGYYVLPTIIDGLPDSHPIMTRELFLPIVAIQTFKTLDEAIARANNTEYGLTAGIFSKDQAEIDTFLARIEGGTVYVNRAAGATTGAWPGVQTFGGWKGSGSSGKNIGGLYTVPLYMREQSQTVVEI